jgi:alpha-ketoglutarate-dependent taurine dioxygenase
MGTQITVKRFTGAIDAEVRGIDLNHALDERTLAIIHQAFLDHSMLVFPRALS